MCSKVSRNLLTLLLVPLIVEAQIPAESHHRESIPREFVFKTIFPPPAANNKLYKVLLQAPFYRRPFPMNNAVLSRGEVYHLADGGCWTMCQDGCVNCEICEVRRNRVVPTAKWTLRRIISGSRRPYQYLQLTLSPRVNDEFPEKNTSPDSQFFVMHSRPRVIPYRKRGRGMRGQRPRLVEGYSIRDDCPMGSDQFGKKRLVHVVPARGNLVSSSNPKTIRQVHLDRSTVLDHKDCRKIFRRVIDSLNTKRSAIDKFLFSSTPDEHASPSPTAGNVLLVENETPSSIIDTTWYNDDRIEQDNEERIRQVAPKTDIDLPEGHVELTNAHYDSESGSHMNSDPKYFHGKNSAERMNSFGYLSAEVSNGSGSTLILKEVAKSVVDHGSDTLQGFNLLTNTATTISRY